MSKSLSDPGPPPELAWLPVDCLAVDPSYQRTIDSKASLQLIEKITGNFSWFKFQAILATPDGDKRRRWLVIDGQHRTEAARRRGIAHVPAVVVPIIDRQKQALAFLGSNRDRRAVTAQELFYAQIAAGDELALSIKKACDAAGIAVVRYNIGVDHAPIGTTPAVSALLHCRKYHGEACLNAAVRAIAKCGRQVRGGLRGEYFLGASLWLHNDGGSPALIDARIEAIGGEEALRRTISGEKGGLHTKAALIASALRRGRSGPNFVAGVTRAQLMGGR